MQTFEEYLDEMHKELKAAEARHLALTRFKVIVHVAVATFLVFVVIFRVGPHVGSHSVPAIVCYVLASVQAYLAYAYGRMLPRSK